MEKNTSVRKDSEVVDLLHVFKTLVKRAWAIALIMIIVGALAFGYTSLFVKPKYSSHVDVFVKTSSIDVGGITAANLSASQSLVNTYIEILKTRDTMEAVIENLRENPETKELAEKYTWSQLLSIVSAESSSETEIFEITVIAEHSTDALYIARSIAKVMEDRVAYVFEDDATLKVVQEAEHYPTKVSPNITKNTLIGALVGFVLGCAFFAFFAILDDTIRNENQVIEMYDLPILAKIPDLNTSSKGYGSGSYGSYNGYHGYHSAKNGGESNE